jgi:hypothetical protein
VNRDQASRLQRRLSARFPGTPVNVSSDSDGARIFMESADGFHVRVTTGDQPGPVLRALLGRDLRLIDGDAEGTALWPSGRTPARP